MLAAAGKALALFQDRYKAAEHTVVPPLTTAVLAEEKRKAAEKATRIALVQSMVRENKALPGLLERAQEIQLAAASQP